MSAEAQSDQIIDQLNADVRLAQAGDAPRQAAWRVSRGILSWERQGPRLHGDGGEWAVATWERRGPEPLATLRNSLIEVTVSGKAEAAGLSFGDFKDFLVELEPNTAPRHLQVEVDGAADVWTFRADGQLMARCWWDSAVHGAADLLSGTLTLKARNAEQVLFQDLTLRTFAVSCQLSVIVTCSRFVQRLRHTLRNWCHQRLPSGALEILIVNPRSPDGTHEHLAAVARSYPEVRVRELAVEPRLALNKGAMINHAVRASRGEWIWLTDADCLFGADSAARALGHIHDRPNQLYFGERRYLTAAQTDALLAGRYDGLHDFDRLATDEHPRGADREPWGYTQIVHRSLIERIRYRDDINHFAHTDNAFVEACRKRAIAPTLIEGLFCLHLDHPFSWYGTRAFL